MRYEVGDTTTQLAKDYGVATSTIIGWFADHPNFYAFLRERQSSLGTVDVIRGYPR